MNKIELKRLEAFIMIRSGSGSCFHETDSTCCSGLEINDVVYVALFKETITLNFALYFCYLIP